MPPKLLLSTLLAAVLGVWPVMTDLPASPDAMSVASTRPAVQATSLEASPIIRASTAADGTQGNGHSSESALDARGSSVAFVSASSNLVPGDTNGQPDIFVKRLDTGKIQRAGGNGASSAPHFSRDGRYVAFSSTASDLVPVDTNVARSDVFLWDTATNAIKLVSQTPSGTQSPYGLALSGADPDLANIVLSGVNPSNGRGQILYLFSVSAGTSKHIITGCCSTGRSASGFDVSTDAKHVAFASTAGSSLNSDGSSTIGLTYIGSANGTQRADVISRSPSGPAGTCIYSHPCSGYPAVFGGASDRYVYYSSDRENIAPGDVDTFGGFDVYRYDRLTGLNQQVTPASDGFDYDESSPSTDASGQLVVFSAKRNRLFSDNYVTTSGAYLKNMVTGEVKRALSGSDSYSYRDPEISGDGSRVAYESDSGLLVAGDTNGRKDIFVVSTGWDQRSVVEGRNNHLGLAGHTRVPLFFTDSRISQSSRVSIRFVSGPGAGQSVICSPWTRFVDASDDTLCTQSGAQVAVDYISPTGGDIAVTSPLAGESTVLLHVDLDGNGVVSLDEVTDTHTIRWYAPVSHLALGDSFSAGDGVAPYSSSGSIFSPTAGANARNCSQSWFAYGQHVSPPDGAPGPSYAKLDSLGLADFQFKACAGAVSRNVYQEPQDFASGYLHPVQLDGVSERTDLVTLTIGGNDAGFANILTSCAEQLDCRNSRDPDLTGNLTMEEYAAERFDSAASRVDDALRAIRQAAPDATIVLLGYPVIFEYSAGDSPYCKASTVLFGGEMAWLDSLSPTLNAKLAQVAAGADVHFVDPTAEFAGHGVCSPVPYFFELNLAVDASGVIQDGPFHPNAGGQLNGYGRALQRWMDCQWRNGGALYDSTLIPRPSLAPSSASACRATFGSAATPQARISNALWMPDSTGGVSAVPASATVPAEADFGMAGWSIEGVACEWARPGDLVTVHAEGFEAGTYITGFGEAPVQADQSGGVRLKVPIDTVPGEAKTVRLRGQRGGVPVVRVLSVATDNAPLKCAGEKPVVTWASEAGLPGVGVEVEVGDTLRADYSCVAATGGSIEQCLGDVVAGDALDTSQVGTSSFSVSAVDDAGAADAVTFHYTVVEKTVDLNGPSIEVMSPQRGRSSLSVPPSR